MAAEVLINMCCGWEGSKGRHGNYENVHVALQEYFSMNGKFFLFCGFFNDAFCIETI
jgi:hypothetical protein